VFLFRTLLLLVLVIALPIFVFAQANNDTIRVGIVDIKATRTEHLSDIGVTHSAIDSLVLLHKLNATLSEVLSENSSIFIKSHGRGALATASFRGTAPSHTQVLWNGISLNSPMLGQVDFSLLPVYFIDQIDLKHGVGSLIDKSGALGGSIGIVNRADWNNKLSFKYIQGIGSFNSFDEFGQFAIGNKTFQMKIRMFHSYSKNNFQYINKMIADIDSTSGALVYPVQRNKNADYKRFGILQEYYYRFNPRNTLSVAIWQQLSDRGIPGIISYEGNIDANINHENNRALRWSAKWKHYRDKTKLSWSVGQDLQDLEYSSKSMIFGKGWMPTVQSDSRTNSLTSKIELSNHLTKKLYLTTGFDATHYSVTTHEAVVQTGYNRQRFESSLFINLYYLVGTHCNFSTLIRQDLIDQKFAPLIPSLGFSYKILKSKELYFRANLAHNYHYPTLNDMYWQPGGNPNLNPESGSMADMSLTYSMRNDKAFIQTDASVYYSNIEDWIIWLPSFKAYWVPFNMKRVVSKGMELRVKAQWHVAKWDIQMQANYALTHSLNMGDKLTWGDESYKKQLPFIPVHSGNLFLHIERSGYYISYSHNSYSERFVTSSNNTTTRDWLYPYYMNNLFVGKTFTIKESALDIEFKIYNLLNERYRTALGQPMPRQNYMLLLKIDF